MRLGGILRDCAMIEVYLNKLLFLIGHNAVPPILSSHKMDLRSLLHFLVICPSSPHPTRACHLFNEICSLKGQTTHPIPYPLLVATLWLFQYLCRLYPDCRHSTIVNILPFKHLLIRKKFPSLSRTLLFEQGNGPAAQRRGETVRTRSKPSKAQVGEQNARKCHSEEEGNGIDIGEEFQTLTELMGRCNVSVQTFQFRLNLQHLKPCE